MNATASLTPQDARDALAKASILRAIGKTGFHSALDEASL